MSSTPIFILGAPRSGTTFLASLLEPSPYGPPFETQFIIKFYKKIANYGDITQIENLERLINDISSERSVMQWGLTFDAKALQQELKNNYNYSDVVNLLCLKASQAKGHSGWGDKTPHYLGSLDTLIELFPNSKFIYIVRDGRDVALSLLQKDWGPNNIYYCAQYWKNLNNQPKALVTLASKQQLLSLRYEDLISDTEEYSKKIFDFLDINYDLERLRRTLNSTMTDNSNKWRSLLSDRQIKIFERIAASTLARYGYETTHEEGAINPLIKAGYNIHNLFFRARHLFIINIIDGIKIRFFNKQPFAE